MRPKCGASTQRWTQIGRITRPAHDARLIVGLFTNRRLSHCQMGRSTPTVPFLIVLYLLHGTPCILHFNLIVPDAGLIYPKSCHGRKYCKISVCWTISLPSHDMLTKPACLLSPSVSSVCCIQVGASRRPCVIAALHPKLNVAPLNVNKCSRFSWQALLWVLRHLLSSQPAAIIRVASVRSTGMNSISFSGFASRWFSLGVASGPGVVYLVDPPEAIFFPDWHFRSMCGRLVIGGDIDLTNWIFRPWSSCYYHTLRDKCSLKSIFCIFLVFDQVVQRYEHEAWSNLQSLIIIPLK